MWSCRAWCVGRLGSPSLLVHHDHVQGRLPADRLHRSARTVISDEIKAVLNEGLQIGIGVVWVLAAFGKVRALAATRDTVDRLLGGPEWVVRIVAQLLPVAEFVLGVALITGWHARIAAGVSAVLFVLFAALILRAAIRDSLHGGGCGCFGSRQASGTDRLVGPRVIARNVVLATLAIAVASGA